MIKKQGSSYYLYSQDGSKKLGGPYNTRAAAVHREKQVTYFKNKAAGDPVPGAKTHAAKEPYGAVEYADPGHQSDGKKRYPIDTEEHIRAAWNYINQDKNAGKYTSGQASSIKSKIVSAWKSKIDKEGPPGAKANAAPTATPSRVDYLGIQAFSAPKPEEGFRAERLHGRNYLVVPVTALVEGVVQGVTATAPELALVNEFGKFPQGWNGRPVVMNHPEMMVDNQAFKVSANSPQILEKYQFGFLFNSKVEDNALKTEAWIDTHRAQHLNDGTRWVLNRLQSMGTGDRLEVSTGLFTGTENHQGKWNGKDYAAIWTGVVPDHLAFLPEGALGACSVADGCGAGYMTLRANCTGVPGCDCEGEPMTHEDPGSDAGNEFKDVKQTKKQKYKSGDSEPVVLRTLESDSAYGAGKGSSPNDPGLTSLDPRITVPEATSDFFLDGMVEPYEPEPQDVGPAEKIEMTNTGPGSDYHGGSMKSWFDEAEDDEDSSQNIERDPTDVERVGPAKKKKLVYDPSVNPGGFGIMAAPDDMLDSDVRSLLQTAVRNVSGVGAYVLGFTNDTVVYSAWDPDDNDFGVFQQSFTINGVKNVEFGDDCQEVILTTEITPITEEEEHSFGSLFDNAASDTTVAADSNLETNAMNSQEARKFLSAFGHTEAALKSMEDPKVLELARGVVKTVKELAARSLAKMAKKRQGSMMDEDNTDIEANPDDDETGKEAGGGKGKQNVPQANLERHPQSLDQLLAAASPDLRESIESGVRMHAQRKEQLIHDLLKTNRCQFRAQELKTFSIAFLENLATLAAVPQDYSGLNVGRQPRLQSRSTGYAPKPPSLVLLKGKNGGNGNGNGKKKAAADDDEDDDGDGFPHTYAGYPAGGPGYTDAHEGDADAEYDGTGDQGDVNVKKTKSRKMASD